MNAEELKSKLKEIFGNQVVFNKDFDYYANSIKNVEDILIKWCLLLKDNKIHSVRAPNLDDEVIFIKKIGSANRCIIIKIKNGEFKEVHLADHVYYNHLTKKLGLKKSSNTY